jgi:hypothetical protein
MQRATFLSARRARPSGHELRSLVAGIALAASVPSTPVWAQEPTFADFPSVIYCTFEGYQNAYYFSQLDPDGRAIYMTPDRQAGAITIDGVAERVDGERPGSCMGKTLSDLRAAGQAFDLPR